jgi:flagellar hook-length control protein FliK
MPGNASSPQQARDLAGGLESEGTADGSTAGQAVESMQGTSTDASATPAADSVAGTTFGRTPAQVLARGTERASSAGRVSNAEQMRLVQRVARAFRAAQDRGGEVRIRLSPPQLGSLKIEVRVEAGIMNARLEAETQAARNALLDNLPALRDRLAEQNVRIEHFDVDVMDRHGGELPDTPDRQPAGFRRSAENQATPTRAAEEELFVDRPAGPLGPQEDGRINVTV